MLELQKTFETSYVFISYNLEHARCITSKDNGKLVIMNLCRVVEGTVENVLQNSIHLT